MAVEISEAQMISEMTGEMKVFYLEFHGNKTKLKAEWNLCNQMYKKAMDFYSSKDNKKQYLRSPMRKIADYWATRRNAMEKVVGDSTVEDWKKEN